MGFCLADFLPNRPGPKFSVGTGPFFLGGTKVYIISIIGSQTRPPGFTLTGNRASAAKKAALNPR